jgi:hypothetical protein
LLPSCSCASFPFANAGHSLGIMGAAFQIRKRAEALQRNAIQLFSNR